MNRNLIDFYSIFYYLKKQNLVFITYLNNYFTKKDLNFEHIQDFIDAIIYNYKINFEIEDIKKILNHLFSFSKNFKLSTRIIFLLNLYFKMNNLLIIIYNEKKFKEIFEKEIIRYLETIQEKPIVILKSIESYIKNEIPNNEKKLSSKNQKIDYEKYKQIYFSICDTIVNYLVSKNEQGIGIDKLLSFLNFFNSIFELLNVYSSKKIFKYEITNFSSILLLNSLKFITENMQNRDTLLKIKNPESFNPIKTLDDNLNVKNDVKKLEIEKIILKIEDLQKFIKSIGSDEEDENYNYDLLKRINDNFVNISKLTNIFGKIITKDKIEKKLKILSEKKEKFEKLKVVIEWSIDNANISHKYLDNLNSKYQLVKDGLITLSDLNDFFENDETKSLKDETIEYIYFFASKKSKLFEVLFYSSKPSHINLKDLNDIFSTISKKILEIVDDNTTSKFFLNFILFF